MEALVEWNTRTTEFSGNPGELEALRSERDSLTVDLLDAQALHLADESTIYQLEHRTVPELEALERQRRFEVLEPRASNICQICGQNWVHQHSPEEIVIYRNGIKTGYEARNAALSARVEALEGALRDCDGALK